MFVGREKELETLERLYSKDSFQMAVIYGRRRVGKTAMIDQFVRNKPVLYFTAQQKSSLQNLQLFSNQVYQFFDLPAETGSFATWTDAFSFIAKQAQTKKERFVLAFDEFPYAAEADTSLPSVLQIAIDHEFKKTAITMILCGSNEGFMEKGVLSRKSPLYGRRNAQIKLQPLNYLEAAKMHPSLSPEEQVRYYATFGGTPYYVEQVDDALTYKENIEQLFFDISGVLYEEPLMFLRQELREPALYNSILDAIGTGATKPKEIAEKAGVDRDSISKYLKTLENLGIIKKVIPLGENPLTTRKGIYRLEDPLFLFWYRFVSTNVGAIENGAGAALVKTLTEDRLNEYTGLLFEDICRQWLILKNAQGKLPFLATDFGKWWGPDPRTRRSEEIDVVAANKSEGRLFVAECKWRNSFNESEAIDLLEQRAKLIQGFDHCTYGLFTKRPATEATKRKAAARDDFMLVSVEELYG